MRKSLMKATPHVLTVKYYVIQKIYRLLDSFARCWEPRKGIEGQSASQVGWPWAVSPRILSLSPKKPGGKSDTAVRSLCASRQFPFSYIFKYTGNNPSNKMRPTTWRWAKVQLKGKKNMFLYCWIFLSEWVGNSFVARLLESCGTWKKG